MGDPDAFEQVQPLAPGGESHVAGDREMGEERVVLGQVADASSLRAEVNPALGVKPHLLAERDSPFAGTLESGHTSQQGGLSRTGWPDESDCLGAEG